MASYSKHEIDDIYIENNYYIDEYGYNTVELENVDINVYHDGYIIVGAKTNFMIQISNNNDFDINLNLLKVFYVISDEFWDRYGLLLKDLSGDEYIDCIRSIVGVQIIDSNGKNILNYASGPSTGYGKDDMDSALIKAGETVTYQVDLILDSKPYIGKGDGNFGVFGFQIEVASENGAIYGEQKTYTFAGYTPTVSVDKEDETIPDLKLDAEAYDKLINSAFTEAEIKSGKHLKADLIVAMLSEADVEQSNLETIKAAAKKRKIAVILDMNIVRLIDGIISGNVNQLDKEITMTIDVPKEFLAANRKFSIIRLHDGIAEELPDLDDNPNTVTFTTGKFSLYALIYEDAEETAVEPPKNDAPDAVITPEKDDKTQQLTASPNTGDTAPIAVVFILMLMSALLIVMSVKLIKKNKKINNNN